MARHGLSAFVSMVLFIGIVIAAIGLALNIAMPQIETMKETAAVESGIDSLTELDTAIQDVAAEGQYSKRQVNIRFKRGIYGFDPESGEIYYELETDSPIISTHATQFMGPVQLSANRDVSITNATINGIDCYMMENRYLEACIRKIPKSFDPNAYPSLVGYWRMDGVSGEVGDVSLYGNNGTNNGATRDVTGLSGSSAFKFNASNNDHVVTTLYPDQNTRGLSYWVKFNNYSNDNSVLGAHDDNNHRFYLGIRDTGEPLAGMGTDFDAFTNYTLQTNQWYHMAMTGDGTTATVYLNGTQIGSFTYSFSGQSTDSFHIGAKTFGGSLSFPMDAVIDEVQVYNRSLTSEEVKWLYLQEGDEHYVNTSEMLVHFYNKDAEKALNGTLYAQINDSTQTRAGQGHTSVPETGSALSRGRVLLNVSTSSEGQYNLTHDLMSGSDFLTIRADADTVTTGLRFVMDSQASDIVYIDGQQRSVGIYDSDTIDFGYGIGQGGTTMSGVVAGSGFTEVGYDDSIGGGRYELNVTATDDSIFLIPFTNGAVDDVENRESDIRNGVIGRFFSYPAPNFGYALGDKKTVHASISYDHVVLDGLDATISPGTYQLLVENNGASNGKTNVSVKIK